MTTYHCIKQVTNSPLYSGPKMHFMGKNKLFGNNIFIIMLKFLNLFYHIWKPARDFRKLNQTFKHLMGLPHCAAGNSPRRRTATQVCYVCAKFSDFIRCFRLGETGSWCCRVNAIVGQVLKRDTSSSFACDSPEFAVNLCPENIQNALFTLWKDLITLWNLNQCASDGYIN